MDGPMGETTGRAKSRLETAPAWTVLTDSPLKGLALARESMTILAWDEGDQVYLIDVAGDHRSVSRAPGSVQAGSISDDGSLVALLVDGGRLLLLSADLEPIAERSAPSDPTALAVDPHGRFVAIATKLSVTQFFTRHGRAAGKFETRQALGHLVFIPDRPLLVGMAPFGLIAGVELRAGNAPGRLVADVDWQEAVLSNVGRLTSSGDGGMLLASCYTHGIQRYDLQGNNEGAYHLGGTVAHAVPDFAGRLIAVATLEGELAILSPGGHVLSRTGLARPALALEVDALGRFLIYGHATGEIVRLDLEPNKARRPAATGGPAVAGTRRGPSGSKMAAESKAAPAAAPGSRSIRQAAWSTPVATSDERAETAVLTILDEPPRIGLLTNANRLQVFTQDGRNLGHAPEVQGIGRILRTAPGWIAAATDRAVALYDARRNAASRVDLSLVEVTHLAIRPDSFGLAIVQ